MSKNPIPADWDEVSWCSFTVCWPESQLWRGLLMGLITSPMRGRFWDEKTGTITDAQDVGREIMDLNPRLEENCMSCTQAEELTAALIAAIAASSGGSASCATGAGCAGATEPPPSQVDPGLPGEQVGDPPDNFDTWQDYEDYKCAVATYIVEGLQVDLAWAETINLVGLTVTGLAAALLTPVPFDDVAAILAFFIALSAQGVFLTAIQAAQSAVADDFEDLVCALYHSANAADAKSKWAIAVDNAIDGETGAFWAGILKAMLKSWVTYAPINDLFEENIPLRNTLPAGDCSGCGNCPQDWNYGSGDIDNGGTFLSAPLASEHRIQFQIGWQQEAQITAITGWTDAIGAPENNWRLASTITPDCASFPFGFDVLNQINPPALPFDMDCVEEVSIRSNTPFSIEWVVVGPGVSCP